MEIYIFGFSGYKEDICTEYVARNECSIKQVIQKAFARDGKVLVEDTLTIDIVKEEVKCKYYYEWETPEDTYLMVGCIWKAELL